MSDSITVIIANSLDVSRALKDQLIINQSASDGVDRFNMKIGAEGTLLLSEILPDNQIYVKYNTCTLLTGYIDSGVPHTDSKAFMNEQNWILSGRNLGQDLMNKMVDKDNSSFPYNDEEISTLIEDMLTSSTCEVSGIYEDVSGITATYKEKGNDYLIDAIRNLAIKTNTDFYITNSGSIRVFPVGSIDSGVTLDSSNIIGDLSITKFDNYQLGNNFIVTGGKIIDSWTDDDVTYLGITGDTGNTLSNSSSIATSGAMAFKSDKGSNEDGVCEISINLPHSYVLDNGKTIDVFGYDSLNLDTDEEQILSFDLQVNMDGTPTDCYLYMELTDTEDHVIKWVGRTSGFVPFSSGFVGAWTNADSYISDKWYTCQVKTGRYVEIQDYDAELGWYDTWRYMTDQEVEGTFNWNVTKITFGSEAYVTQEELLNYLLIDNLQLPFNMKSKTSDTLSISEWKRRDVPLTNNSAYSQRELNEWTESKLEQSKYPASAVRCKVIGTVGINDTEWVLRPGFITHIVNEENDLDDDLRIAECQLNILNEPDENGHVFTADLVLTSVDDAVRGQRLSAVSNPSLGIQREVFDKIRNLEKNNTGNNTDVITISSSGGGGSDWDGGIVNQSIIPKESELGIYLGDGDHIFDGLVVEEIYTNKLTAIDGSIGTNTIEIRSHIIPSIGYGATLDIGHTTIPMRNIYMEGTLSMDSTIFAESVCPKLFVTDVAEWYRYRANYWANTLGYNTIPGTMDLGTASALIIASGVTEPDLISELGRHFCVDSDIYTDSSYFSGEGTIYLQANHNWEKSKAIGNDDGTVTLYSDARVTGDLVIDGTIVGYESGTGANSLSELSIDVTKNWNGYGITNLGTISGTKSSFTTVYAGTYLNSPSTLLSSISINVSKDWGGYNISNLGTVLCRVLDNVATNVTLNASMYPLTDVAFDLGGASNKFNRIYSATMLTGNIWLNTILTSNGSTGTVTIGNTLTVTGPIRNTAGSILLNTDVNLYRSGANTLKTDDVLHVAGNYLVSNGDIQINKSDPYLVIQTSGSDKLHVGHDGTNSFLQSKNGVMSVGADNNTVAITKVLQIGVDTQEFSGSTKTWDIPDWAYFHQYVVNTDGYKRYLDIASVGDQDGSNGGGIIRFLTNTVGTDTAEEWLRIANTITISANVKAKMNGTVPIITLGDGNNYFSGVITDTLYYKSMSTFDAYDDLLIASKYGEKDEDISILQNSLGFYDSGKVNGFLIGCVKALTKEVNDLKEEIKTIKEEKT